MRHSSLAIGLSLVLFGVSAPADEPKSDTRTAHDFEGFVDGVMGTQREAHHFAGAVVVIVSDGQVVFKKGYGYADFAARKPVDPSRSLFRVASNTKMFTSTAVMQLVEQGKLDLHTDVNRYLKGVQIPQTFPQPITLEHLMTHTPGFEDRIFGLFSKSPDAMRSLVERMRDGMPARIYAPGTVPAYSNYGVALAGLIVEQVSGIPYAQYIEDRILAPLGMTHATARQPVPKNLVADLSKGYRWSGGRLIEQPFEHVPWAPAGGMSVSGEDMGRFMLAHLGDGALGDARILRTDTARLMRQRLVSFSPKINGMLHGFMERGQNGEAAYGHGGTTTWFHSLSIMLPERNLGVFVAYNTDSGQAAVGPFADAFFDHFFPTSLEKETAPARDTRAQLERFAGTYATSRVSESGFLKFVKILGTTITVDDGYLVMRSPEEVTRWRQSEPLVFRQVDGHRTLVFRENDRGELTDLCTSPVCTVAMQKQPWWNSTIPQLSWLGACLAILLIALIGMPVAAVSQRLVPKPAGAKLARWVAWTTSVTFLSGAVAFSVGLMDANATILFGDATPALRLGLTLFVVGSLLSACLIVLTLMAWRQRWWHVAGRICATIVSLAALGIVAWLYQWNLLGWNY